MCPLIFTITLWPALPRCLIETRYQCLVTLTFFALSQIKQISHTSETVLQALLSYLAYRGIIVFKRHMLECEFIANRIEFFKSLNEGLRQQ